MPAETIVAPIIRTKRLPRYRRVSLEERPPFKLTKRDRELLKIIYDHRFITAGMLQDLAAPVSLTPRQQEALTRLIAARRSRMHTDADVWEDPVSCLTSKIPKRLQSLYHHGYVQRHKLSDHDPIIYALGNRGADELMLYYGVDRQKIDWTSKNREAGERYIHHSLMVSRFRHALALALREHSQTALHFWEPNGAFTASVTFEEATHPSDGRRTQQVRGTVNPDGFFALTNGAKTAYFFLEADRSTMTNARYLAKLKSYFHYWVTQVRGGQHPSGMQAFRVLTLTVSESRKDNLRRTAHAVDPEGRGLNLFWFVCEQSYHARPQELLAAIWQTPQEDTRKSIFV